MCVQNWAACVALLLSFLGFLYHLSQKRFRQRNLGSVLLFPTRIEQQGCISLASLKGYFLLDLMTLCSAAAYMGNLQKIRIPPVPSAMMRCFLIAWILMTTLSLFVLFLYACLL